MTQEHAPKPASGSIFTVDFLLAAALIVAHSTYTYNVYHAYSKPEEMQQLKWWLPVAATVAYGAMIFFGKKFMSTRRPENPRSAMLLYNIYQSLINGFMAAWLVFQAYRAGFTLWGNYPDNSVKGYPIAFGLWMHYNNKYLELFDTFFMVVKKKDDQISFLHVYHHILLVWSWFVCILFCVGGDGYFGSAFNSLVHFFMYAYYALALFAIPCPWKQHLTMFQMIQFVCCASQSCWCFYRGNLWWPIPALQLFVMINMLVLFSRFYKKKYNKRPAAGAAAGGAAEVAASGKGSQGKVAKLLGTTAASSSASPASTASPSPTFSTALVNVPSPVASPAPVAAAPSSSASNGASSSSSKKKKSASSSSKKKSSRKAE